MARKKRVVVVDWSVGNYEDSHDFVVFADSPAAAKAKARSRWLQVFGRENGATVSRIWILTDKAAADLGLA